MQTNTVDDVVLEMAAEKVSIMNLLNISSSVHC